MGKLKSQFQKAVSACPDLTLKDGVEAIAHANRRKIRPQNPRSVTGSIDIDKDLKNQFPEDPRWDYAVGYKGSGGREKVYFIEVHPAETSEIGCVIQKVRALKIWAQCHAPDLWNMTIPREIHWVASGRCGIRLNDSYRRQLALSGLDSPKQYLILT
jgi:hypothetical protein